MSIASRGRSPPHQKPEFPISCALDSPDVDALPLVDGEENPLKLRQLVGPVRLDFLSGLKEIHFNDAREQAKKRKRRNGEDATECEVHVEDLGSCGSVQIITEQRWGKVGEKFISHVHANL